MLSVHTLASMAQQMAGLVIGPRHRHSGANGQAGAPVEGYGLCPSCGDWIRLEVADREETAPCPSCGKSIAGVSPLGGDGAIPR